MVEHNEDEIRLEAFRIQIEIGLDLFLDNPEIAANIHFVPDPLSLGIDERSYFEVSPIEREIINKVIFMKLGITKQNIDPLRVREYDGGDGMAGTVYRTNRTTLGIYLHKNVYPNGMTQWVVGSKRNVE